MFVCVVLWLRIGGWLVVAVVINSVGLVLFVLVWAYLVDDCCVVCAVCFVLFFEGDCCLVCV